ncbi:MAG: putative ABC transporter permease [Tissierellia bacterium]|nr:putative ABC transporter permease [Tissierellia bacterium]
MDILSYFLIYAFLGWCVEVAYAAVKERKFVNRGMLNGAVCPIYGFGVLLVLLLLEPYKNVILLFIMSVIICSVLEYITGFLLEKIFHTKWWDYSDRKFNLRGYICLEFSIYWGAFCVIIVLFIQPLIKDMVLLIDEKILFYALIAFYFLLMIDIISTVQILYRFKLKLNEINNIGKDLKAISNDIGYKVYKRAIKIDDLILKQREMISEFEQYLKNPERAQEIKNENMARIHSRLDSIKSRHESLSNKVFGLERLMKAFPSSRSEKYSRELIALKQRIRDRRNRK